MTVEIKLGTHGALLQLDAVIVDLDGTMVDTIGDFTQAIARMLADMQLPAVSAGDIAQRVGKGSEHLLRSVLAHVLAPAHADADGDAGAAVQQAVAAHLPQALALYEHHYLAINGQHSAVYDGVVQGLSALHAAGLKLACVTNKPMAFTQPLLAAKGLDAWFDVVFGGDSFDKKKPDPLPLLKACEALGTIPMRTLMVGDSSNDAQAARAAGCPVVLLSYGYNHGEPIDRVDADGCLDSIAQLHVQ